MNIHIRCYSVYHKNAFPAIRANVTFGFYKDGELTLSTPLQYNIGDVNTHHMNLTRHLDFDAGVSICKYIYIYIYIYVYIFQY